MSDLSPFGRFVVAELAGAGMSRGALISKMQRQGVEVHRQSLTQWMSGERRPRYRALVALLDALAVHGDKRAEALNLVAGVSEC